MNSVLAQLKQVYRILVTVLRRSHISRLQAGESIADQPSTDPWSHYNQGKVFVEQEQWQAAIASCEQAIALDPTCPWFYKTLAEAYMGQGHWEQAIAVSTTAIELSPENSWLHHTLAKALIGKAQWQEAITACQQAIALDPTVSWFYHHLGEALVKSGQWDAAIAPLQTAIQLDPAFAWSYYYLGEALVAKEHIAAAIEIYQQVIQKHPDIAYLQSCLDYANHLQTQEQRIQTYCHQTYYQKAHNATSEAEGNRLRILMLTPYPTYPPKLGAITRMFHEMQTLGAKHELVVVSFIFSKDHYSLEADLETYCELGITVMIGDAPPRQPQQPQLIHRYSSARMRKLLQLLQPANFDIVLCDFIYMAQYIDLFPNAFLILGEHNIESRLLQRCAAVNQDNTQLSQLAQQSAAVRAFVESDSEATLLARFEDEYWQRFPLRMVVSEQDRQEMDGRCRFGKTIVVNNGIDTTTITPVTPEPNQTILFIGTMSYYPNIDGVCYFVETILPIIWQHNPAVAFCIAGAEPPQTVLDFAQDARITVVANPEQMSEVARHCCMTVVPLRIGSGTRIKILHSMAMGLPVVSTALGCEGLAVEDGVHLLVRDHPEAFAQAILQLLEPGELQQNLRQNGRNLVEQHYDWQQIFQAAEQEMMLHFRAWQQQSLSFSNGIEAD